MSRSIPSSDPASPVWNDRSLSVDRRVAALLAEMTLTEKVGQLSAIWPGATGADQAVAPHVDDVEGDSLEGAAIPLSAGVGHLTRLFGSAPIEPAAGAAALSKVQHEIAEANRFGIPAIAHEECLAGFTTWGATAYPVPLAWGATFNPEIVTEMGGRIGQSMRSVGVHQGLAPVLDVSVDARWGRTEETIGEDPYLVGVLASAYIRGLESSGIIATLKHFVGYSASRSARNLAPVSIGQRELADTLLLPFEMAVRESGVRSVMHSYASIDGVPAVASQALLTDLLREKWGFTGTVVADYFGIGFLKLLHRVAGTWGEAGALALRAGVDVELPAQQAFARPLITEVEEGRLSEKFVDRAVTRVLRQKAELGLLDQDWNSPDSGGATADPLSPDHSFDTDADRKLARTIAEQSVVLVKNDGVLPVVGGSSDFRGSIAVIGPAAHDAICLVGCYSFPNHVGVHHPDLPIGISMPTVFESVQTEFPNATIRYAQGCEVDGETMAGFADALALVNDSDLTLLVLGDRAGLFGRGTSGEGCDAHTLKLPGVQAELLEEILSQSGDVVLIMMSGRPYYLGSAPERARAIVQSFFPGEEGGSALAGIVSGRVNPSGRLPISMPGNPSTLTASYLSSGLAQKSEVSNVDPTAAYPFGHGLGFSEFSWSEPTADGLPLVADAAVHTRASTDGTISIGLTVCNESNRTGVEVVQLYLHDPVASVVLPNSRLIGFVRVELAAQASTVVSFAVPADLASFTGIDGSRRVEPGKIALRLARSSDAVDFTINAVLDGPVRTVGHDRRFHCEAAAQVRN